MANIHTLNDIQPAPPKPHQLHVRYKAGKGSMSEPTTLVPIDSFLDALEQKKVGYIFPEAYAKPVDTTAVDVRRIARADVEYLRYVGLLDLDIEGAKVTQATLNEARHAIPKFNDLLSAVELFLTKYEGNARVFFTGGKGVRLAFDPTEDMFVKCSWKSHHADAIVDKVLPHILGDEAFAAIKPFVDKSVLRTNSFKSEFFMKPAPPGKEGSRFMGKSLLFDKTTRKFDNAKFTPTEDPDLSTFVQDYWKCVFKVAERVDYDSKVLLPKDSKSKKNKKRKPSARAAQFAAAKRQKLEDAHAKLVAYFKNEYPILKDAELTVETFEDSCLKVKVMGRCCPIAGREHTTATGAAFFVSTTGMCTMTCFSDGCENQKIQLPDSLTEALFDADGVKWTDHVAAETLLEMLNGTVRALDSKGKLMYFFNENTRLWESTGCAPNVLRSRIMNEFPAYLEKMGYEKYYRVSKKGEHVAIDPDDYANHHSAETLTQDALPMIFQETDQSFLRSLNADTSIVSLQGRQVLELKTMTVRERTKEDMCTDEIAAAWPEEGLDFPTPRVESFFRQILDLKDESVYCDPRDQGKGKEDNEGLYAYIQALLGMVALTGETSDRSILFLIGDSAGNGKTVLNTMLETLMGNFAVTCSKDVFESCTAKAGGAASPQLAELLNKRIAVCEEFSDKTKLDDNAIKRLTGGSKLKCRPLYGDPIEFAMQAKFVIASNNRPNFHDINDPAIISRLILLPFNVMFRDHSTRDDKYTQTNPNHRWRNKDLPAEAETSAFKQQLLVWLAQGARAYYANGGKLLGMPPSVSAFGRQIQAEGDTVAEFIDDTCEIDPNFDPKDMAAYIANKDTRFVYSKRAFYDAYKRAQPNETTITQNKLIKDVKRRYKGRIGEHKFGLANGGHCLVGIKPFVEDPMFMQ